jgi:SOS-response transcriptional repressor LexA
MISHWGFRVKQLREDRHWLQEDVAVKSGLSRGMIGRIETGSIVSCTPDTLQALSKAFDIPQGTLAQYLYGGDKPPDFPETNKLSPPMKIPIYTDFPFHAGTPIEPIEYRDYAQIKPSQKHIEGYIVHGNCLEPKIENNDIIIVDRDGQIDNGDIVACLIAGELHLARLRKVADELWLENNNKRYRFQECQVAVPVIEVIKKLK